MLVVSSAQESSIVSDAQIEVQSETDKVLLGPGPHLRLFFVIQMPLLERVERDVDSIVIDIHLSLHSDHLYDAES